MEIPQLFIVLLNDYYNEKSFGLETWLKLSITSIRVLSTIYEVREL
jgi:hypothetical protein